MAAAEEQVADLRQSSAEVARELAAVRPRYLEGVEVMTKRLVAGGVSVELFFLRFFALNPPLRG